MNNTRRKAIMKIAERLEELKTDFELLRDEEQEAFDNMPESIQESERGEQMQEAIDALDEACCSIDEAIDRLGEI